MSQTFLFEQNPDSDNESDHDDHSQLDSAIQAISLNAADQDASNRITAERFNIEVTLI
jgi:hypothetical protein